MKKIFFISILLISYCSFAYTSIDVSNAVALSEQGIIAKQSDETKYRLDDTISRAELTKIALILKKINTTSGYKCRGYFSDISPDWICQSAEIAADNSIISRSNKKFRPQDSVTLMEATAILTKSVNFKYTKKTPSLRIGEGMNGYKNLTQEQIDILNELYNSGIVSYDFVSNIYLPTSLEGKPGFETFVYGKDKKITRGMVFELVRKLQSNVKIKSSACEMRKVGDETYGYTTKTIYKNDIKMSDVEIGVCGATRMVFFMGTKIYFTADPDGIGGYILYGNFFNLYEFDTATNKITGIIDTFTDIDIDFKSGELVYGKGGQIFVSNLKSNTIKEIYTLPPNTIDGQIGSYLLSPDGKKIAFGVGYGPDNESGEVYVVDRESKKITLYKKTVSAPHPRKWLNGNPIW